MEIKELVNADGVGGGQQRRAQGRNTKLLDAAVTQGDVAGFRVKVAGPGPGVGQGRLQLLHGGERRGRCGSAAPRRAVGNAVVAHQDDLRVAFGGVAVDKVANFRFRIPRGAAQKLSVREVGGVAGMKIVRRAINDLGRAQFVGHHLKGPARIVSIDRGSRRQSIGDGEEIILRAAGGRGHGHGILVAVVTAPEAERQAGLPDVIDATDFHGFFLGRGERGQKHGRQNRDDRDNDEKFDQRKGLEEVFFHNQYPAVHVYSGVYGVTVDDLLIP